MLLGSYIFWIKSNIIALLLRNDTHIVRYDALTWKSTNFRHQNIEEMTVQKKHTLRFFVLSQIGV